MATQAVPVGPVGHVDPKQKADARTNISLLAPYVWNLASEDRKFQVGARHEHFLKQADQERKVSADEFLTHVGGQQYRADDVLAIELLDKLRSLMAAHVGTNNFYNEWPHAQSLESSMPVSGTVPKAARIEWVKTITLCHIGNGFGNRGGVDVNADVYYRKYIGNFRERDVLIFLRLFGDTTFTVDFDKTQADRRARDLITTLKSKTKNVHATRALDALLAQPTGTLSKAMLSTKFKEAMVSLPKS